MPTKPAVWNKHPFTCPGPCGRHFDRDQIRVKHVRNEWMCQRCADEISGVVTPSTIEVGICATCGVAVPSGRRTVNTEGRIVHKGGCPSKNERAARQQRRERRRRRPDQ
jgi:NMD protein affecting ribosome stability and mRNA decay